MDVIAAIISLCFTNLRNYIANENLDCPAGTYGCQQVWNQNIRQEARIKAARPDDDHVCGQNSLDDWREGCRVVRFEPDPAHAPGHLRDLTLTLYAHLVRQVRQLHVGHEAHVA